MARCFRQTSSLIFPHNCDCQRCQDKELLPYFITITATSEAVAFKLIVHLLHKGYLIFYIQESHPRYCPVFATENLHRVRPGWALVVFPNYAYGDLCDLIMTSASQMSKEDIFLEGGSWFEEHGPRVIGFCHLCQKGTF